MSQHNIKPMCFGISKTKPVSTLNKAAFWWWNAIYIMNTSVKVSKRVGQLSCELSASCEYNVLNEREHPAQNNKSDLVFWSFLTLQVSPETSFPPCVLAVILLSLWLVEMNENDVIHWISYWIKHTWRCLEDELLLLPWNNKLIKNWMKWIKRHRWTSYLVNGKLVGLWRFCHHQNVNLWTLDRNSI